MMNQYMTESGKVFDHTVQYTQEAKEIVRFLDYYFAPDEIEDKVILDAGCRVGDYAIEFVRKGAKKVVGIDLSENCIQTAQKRFPDIPNLTFQVGDITNLNQLEDTLFDVAICVGTIIYLPAAEMEKALQELRRVIKKGGTLLILFQKEKGWVLKTVRWVANFLPLPVYLFWVKIFAGILSPLVSYYAGRKVNREASKYLLIGLRGIYFGVPKSVEEKFRIQTVTCEQCSETSSASYKIII